MWFYSITKWHRGSGWIPNLKQKHYTDKLFHFTDDLFHYTDELFHYTDELFHFTDELFHFHHEQKFDENIFLQFCTGKTIFIRFCENVSTTRNFIRFTKFCLNNFRPTARYIYMTRWSASLYSYCLVGIMGGE